jgi:hypothetical protein
MDEIIKNLYLGDYQDALMMAYSSWKTSSGGIRPPIPDGWQYLAVTEYQNETPLEPWGAVVSPFMGFAPKSDEARVEVLDNNAMLILYWISKEKRVLVHCSHGHERSPLQVVWYLHKYDGMSLDDAYDFVVKKHPTTARRIYWIPQQYRPFTFGENE